MRHGFESRHPDMTTYRSKLEERLHSGPLQGCPYEPTRVSYPVKRGWYTPDFVAWRTSPYTNVPTVEVWIEAKGFFSSRDRTKMKAVKKEYPECEIRFVFQTPYQTLSRTSDTTYAQWAEQHGFPWCDAKDTTTLARWAKGEL